MNVLVTSISNKVPMLKAVRRALTRANPGGMLVGADLNPDCIGSFFVDWFWACPPLHEWSIDDLIQDCRSQGISAIIPSRDGELSYFAAHRLRLWENGIATMVSDPSFVQMCTDKLLFYRKLTEAGFPAIPTGENLPVRSERYVVKERFGAGGIGAGIGLDAEQAKQYAKKLQSPIFQPYIEGEEYSVDLYRDRQGRVKGVIPRRRIRVVNGESQVSETVRDAGIEALCKAMAESFDAYGHILFQLIVDPNGQWHVIECNCRFGGASTLSVAAGLDSFYWFLLESRGLELNDVPFERSTRELTLVRHAEDWIR